MSNTFSNISKFYDLMHDFESKLNNLIGTSKSQYKGEEHKCPVTKKD